MAVYRKVLMDKSRASPDPLTLMVSIVCLIWSINSVGRDMFIGNQPSSNPLRRFGLLECILALRQGNGGQAFHGSDAINDCSM